MKKIKIIAVFIAIIFFFNAVIFGVNALSAENAYLGIVKIYAYYEDENFNLTRLGSGSGVIINENGIILTNSHVVSLEDDFKNELPVSLMVCVTESVSKKPDCAYSADIIAKNNDSDVALLKIRPVPGISSKKSFDSVTRNADQEASQGEPVKALGYPAIGGETITVTSGTVSGVAEKHSLSWIKTDALFSYGSSGGALIDSTGVLLGITTQAYSDFLGTMGYVIDLASINSWIDGALEDPGLISPLQARMDAMIAKKYHLENENVFSFDLPRITVVKESEYKFDYYSENILRVEHLNDQNLSGGIHYSFIKGSMLQENSLKPTVEILKLMSLDIMNFISEESVSISGIEGKKLIYEIFGHEANIIILPIENYILNITFFYSENETDKSEIDQMVNSTIITKEGIDFSVLRSTSLEEPYLTLNIQEGWSLGERNSSSNPVYGTYMDDPFLGFDIYIESVSNSVQKISNADYWQYAKPNDMVEYQHSFYFGIDSELYYENPNDNIGGELYDDIKYKYKFFKESDKSQTLTHVAGYRIRSGDKVIIIGLEYIGGDSVKFEEYVALFEKQVIKNISIGRSAPEIVIQLDDRKLSSEFGFKQAGKILLQVESSGEAWYLDPIAKTAYYLGRPDNAFEIMRKRGIGITNRDLERIPIGLSELSGKDSDGDGLSDIFEDAIGTDKYQADTDGDGYDDRTEILNGYSPLLPFGPKISYDQNFINSKKGMIFLQVENNGEAWYVSPADGKRYFLGRPTDAFNIMRGLGVGISENDFQKI